MDIEMSVIQDVQLPGASWRLKVSPHREIFSRDLLLQAEDLLQRWSKIFPRGNTWVGREYKVPSLMVRIDCVVHDGVLRVYEIEDRPCGFGVSTHTVPGFKEKLDGLRAEWPAFRWVRAPNRETDDELWLGPGLTLEEAKQTDGLLLVRSRPEDREYHVLESRAISTVQHEGDKRYGADPTIGIYRLLEWIEDPAEQAGGFIQGLPTGPFVVKPWRGTRAREVRFHANGHIDNTLQVQRRDRISLGDLERWMRTNKKAICQELIHPMRLEMFPGKNTIYRMFFGYSPSKRVYVPLDGVWMASDSLIVHGNNETISGPLLCQV